MKKLLITSVIVSPALFLSGCASVSVAKVENQSKKAFQAPSKIYVQEFITNDSVFRVNRTGSVLKDFKAKTASQLSTDLVKQLNQSDLPAEAKSKNSKTPTGNYWLVTGTFERVDQGSRALRSIVGFGVGRTRIETKVVVMDLRGSKPTELFSFKTIGSSNQEPGPGIIMGAIPMNLEGPFSIVYGPTMTGLSFDIRRTAKEIAAETSDYLQKNGVAPKDKKLKVKRLSSEIKAEKRNY
jgi:hypothetical protein